MELIWISEEPWFSLRISVLKLSKSGWFNASLTVILFSGLNCNKFSRKSMASGVEPANFSEKLQRLQSSKMFKYLMTSLSYMKVWSVLSGKPMTSKIDERIPWSGWFTELVLFLSIGISYFLIVADLDLNSGSRSKKVGEFSFNMPSSSAKMQPTDHMSTAGLLLWLSRYVSGAAKIFDYAQVTFSRWRFFLRNWGLIATWLP